MSDSFLPPLVAVVTADIREYSAKMAEARGEAKATADAGQSHFDRLAKVGKVAALGLAGGAIAVGAASIKMAADFQEGLTTLVTGAGEAESNLGLIRKGVLNLSVATGQSTKQLTDGLYLIESAGYHGAAGLSVLKAAAQGARVGNADLGTVAGAVTTVLTDYHLKSTQAAAATSALVQTVASGKTHMEDLGRSLGAVLPLASALHVSFPQVAGAMAVMTNAGMNARRSAMLLNNTIRSLAAPSGIAIKSMNAVGLSAQQVKDAMSHKGLSGALQLVEEHISKKFPAGSVASVTAFKNILGGAAGYNTALMLGGKNMKTYEANVKSIGTSLNSTGKNVQGWAQVQKDFNFKLDQARQFVEAFAIRLGTWLIPKVEATIAVVAKVVGWLTKHKDIVEAVGIALAVVLLPAVIAYTVSMITAAAATIAATWPLIAIVAAIALVAYGALQLAKHWSAVWGSVKSIALDAWHFLDSKVLSPIRKGFDDTVGTVERTGQKVIGFLTRWGPMALAVLFPFIGIPLLIWQHFSQIEGFLTRAWNGAVRATRSGISDAIGYVKALPGRIMGALASLETSLFNFGANIIHWLVQGIESAAGDVASAVSGLLHSIPGASILHKIHIPGFANGTDFAPGGIARVGERGPETVYLPRGSQVIPHHIAPSTGGGGNTYLHVTLTGPVMGANPDQLADELRLLLVRAGKRSGNKILLGMA